MTNLNKRLFARVEHFSLYLLYLWVWRKFIYEFWKFKKETHERMDEGDKLMWCIGEVCYDNLEPCFTNLQIIRIPGPGHNSNSQHGICWESPTGIIVRLEDVDMVGFGFALKGDTLYVLQMQGTKGVRVPRGWYMWPKLLLEGSILFAKKHNMREVRVRRAHRLAFYAEPIFAEPLTIREYQSRRIDLRIRLRRRYDDLPLELGFTMEEEWMVWQNPDYKRS